MQCLEIFLIFAISFFALFYIEESTRSLIHSAKLFNSSTESLKLYDLSFLPLLNGCTKTGEITLCRNGVRSWTLIDEAYYEK